MNITNKSDITKHYGFVTQPNLIMHSQEQALTVIDKKEMWRNKYTANDVALEPLGQVST